MNNGVTYYSAHERNFEQYPILWQPQARMERKIGMSCLSGFSNLHIKWLGEMVQHPHLVHWCMVLASPITRACPRLSSALRVSYYHLSYKYWKTAGIDNYNHGDMVNDGWPLDPFNRVGFDNGFKWTCTINMWYGATICQAGSIYCPGLGCGLLWQPRCKSSINVELCHNTHQQSLVRVKQDLVFEYCQC